jgi:hypothetical protein
MAIAQLLCTRALSIGKGDASRHTDCSVQDYGNVEITACAGMLVDEVVDDLLLGA